MRPARNPATRAARALAPAALFALLVLLPGRAWAQGVATALAPSPEFVDPGAAFDLDLQVPVSGPAFNGFHAVIGYDPAALTFVQAVPVAGQVGCLMNGGCSAACGATFHVFQTAGDSLVVDLSLLCDQIHLTGPGQVYRLHFVASDTAQVTWVRVRSAVFYDAGIGLAPGTMADSRVVIGSPAGVGPTRPAGGWRVAARPNPAPGAVALSITAPADGEQAIDVLDLSGRVVRHLAGGWSPRGARALAWDGTGADGGRLPAGVYLVRLRAGGHVAATRVTLVH